MEVDANEIVPGLWQGSVPPVGSALRESGFDVLFLMAREVSLRASLFPGVRVYRVPTEDNFELVSSLHAQLALSSAARAASHVANGENVLVTCHAGLNRSGLVSAACICMLFGISGVDSIRLVKRARRGSLSNPSFCNFLVRSFK